MIFLTYIALIDSNFFCIFLVFIMPTCVVLGCHSGSGREEKKYQLESFPKSEEFKQKWIEKINRKDFEPSFNSRICFKHFRRSDFLPCDDNKDKQGRQRKLKKLKVS